MNHKVIFIANKKEKIGFILYSGYLEMSYNQWKNKGLIQFNKRHTSLPGKNWYVLVVVQRNC